MAVYCVYIHTAPNGKRYVGITSQSVSKRWKNGNGYIENKHFHNAIKKYGWDAIKHEIVADSLTKSEACDLEQKLIAQYKTACPDYGYNNSIGGEAPALGMKHSAETKKRMSKAKLGKRKSEETILKMQAAQRHRPVGPQNPRYGIVGKANKKAKKILQFTKQGEYVATYYGAPEVTKVMNIKSPSKIYDVCHGVRKSAYGYIWAYEERDDVVV